MASKYNKPSYVLKPSRRGQDMKPERRMSPKQYAGMLVRMLGNRIDPVMRNYSRNYDKVLRLALMAAHVNNTIILKDGSRISDHVMITASGKMREGVSHVRRYITAKGSTQTASGADTEPGAMSTGNLWRNQRGLPVGSCITESIKLGRPSVPVGRGFNPVKLVTYKSDQRGNAAFSHDLFKAPAFRARSIGINEIYGKLIPLEGSELQQRRLSIMQRLTQGYSHNATDARVRQIWDTPTTIGSSATYGDRSTYWPHNLTAKVRYTNLNEVLTSKVRFKVLQLRGPNANGNDSNAAQSYLPWEELDIALNAMPVQAKVSTTASALAADAYLDEPSAGTQHCWGYTEPEFAGKHGSYDFITRKSISTSPVWRENFNEVYSTEWVNVGAGSSYQTDLCHYINRNYSQSGNLDQVSAENSFTSCQLFILAETKGRADTEYYKFARPALTRTFSSGTGPVSFAYQFETGLEFATQDQPIPPISGAPSGLPYKKGYINIENEIDVSEIINQPYDVIYASEADIPEPTAPATISTGIIVPVVKTSNVQGSQQRGVKT